MAVDTQLKKVCAMDLEIWIDLNHIYQTTTGPVVALTELDHIHVYQTTTVPVVAQIYLGHIYQTTTRPVVT